MSDKERIVQLLDDVPAYKLGYITDSYFGSDSRFARCW